jgi:hypothetical protein
VTQDEASNAAVAVCNLGLENWPAQWLAGKAPTPTQGLKPPLYVERARAVTAGGIELPEDFLLHQDLVTVFQVGWTVLHEDVCMYAADKLINVLTSAHSADGYIQDALDTLRVTLTKYWRAGSPWEARDALEVIAILDTPSWAALLGFLDQFPTLHAAVAASLAQTTRGVDPAAFEFISENTQIQQIRDFLQLMPTLILMEQNGRC